MNKAYKIKLYPNKTQSHIIDITIGCSRFIYNQMLNERIEVYEKLKDNKELLYSYKYKTEKEYKEIYSFLKDASSRALQQARGDLNQAFQNFYNGLKKGKKIGFPKFKSKHKVKWSYREPQFYIPNKNKIFTAIEIKDNKIKLNKLGFVKFRGLNNNFQGEIKSVTITKLRDMTYEASILIEQKQSIKIRKANDIIGIDLGLKEFIVCSNGEFINGIKDKLYDSEKPIKKQQKHLSRKKNKQSKRYLKCKIKLNKIYQYKVNFQNHFFWCLANKLCNENQVIGIEDLNVNGMIKNDKLSHSIHYSSWSKFIVMLEQKSKEYGTTIHKIDRFYPSSKTCSNCGEKKATLSLGEREYRCEFCGNVIDRDLNASINIRNQTCKDLSLEYDDYKHGEIIRPNYHYSGYFYEVLRNFNNDRNNVC